MTTDDLWGDIPSIVSDIDSEWDGFRVPAIVVRDAKKKHIDAFGVSPGGIIVVLSTSLCKIKGVCPEVDDCLRVNSSELRVSELIRWGWWRRTCEHLLFILNCHRH